MKLVWCAIASMVLTQAAARAQETAPPSKNQLEAAKREQARQVAELEQIAIRREAAGLQARATSAIEAIDTLKKSRDEAKNTLEQLKSSSDGRAFALDRAGEIGTYRAVVARIEEIRQEDLNLKSAEATKAIEWTKSASSMPDAEMRDSVVKILGWTEEHLKRVATDQAMIRFLVTNAVKGVKQDGLPTLGEVLTAREAEEAKVRAQALAAARQEGLAEANRLAFEVEKTKVIETARQEETVRLLAARTKNLQREVEATEKARKEEADLIRRMADAESELKMAKADTIRKVAETDAQVATKEAEAQMLRDRSEVRTSPRVQALLKGPFFTPGNYQPGSPAKQLPDKKPISLAALRAYGALEEPSGDNYQGLQRLLDVATYDKDKVRPRWAYKRKLKDAILAGQVDEIREAQQLLIRLGPAMVEEGLLSK